MRFSFTELDAPLIAGCSYVLGEPVPLGELVGDGVTQDEIDKLRERGQELCRISDDEDGMLTRVVLDALAKAGVAPADIDGVLLATESILITGTKPGHEHRRGRLQGLLARIGLAHAPVTVVTFAGCSSALTLLAQAGQLVGSGSAGRVLVVAIDRVLEHRIRVLRPNVTVVSDGAAACVVLRADEAGDRAGWRLRWVGRQAFHHIAEHDRASNFAPALVELGRALLRFRRGDLPGLPIAMDQVRLLCNNYGLPSLRMFASTLGVPRDNLFVENVPRTGHLGCPDPLLNLADAPAGAAGAIVIANAPADVSIGWLTAHSPSA